MRSCESHLDALALGPMRAITLPLDTEDESQITPPAPAAEALGRLLQPTNRILLQVLHLHMLEMTHSHVRGRRASPNWRCARARTPRAAC